MPEQLTADDAFSHSSQSGSPALTADNAFASTPKQAMSGDAWDHVFGLSNDDALSPANVAKDFGQGFASNWGAYSSQLIEERDAAMKPYLSDVNTVHSNIAKAFNEAVVRPAAWEFFSLSGAIKQLAIGLPSSVVSGLEQVPQGIGGRLEQAPGLIGEGAKAIGTKEIGETAAQMIEYGTMRGDLQLRPFGPAEIAQAKSLGVIGEGAAEGGPQEAAAIRGQVEQQKEAQKATAETVPQAPVDVPGAAPVSGGAEPKEGLQKAAMPTASSGPTPEEIAAAHDDIKFSRGPVPMTPSLFATIKDMGGVKLRDAAGDVTKEGQDIQALLQDVNRPGLVNNKTGMAPDALRAALQDEGWFGPVPDQHGPDALQTGSYPGDDISDLHDLIDKEARGDKVYHPNSDTAQNLRDRSLLDEELGRAAVGPGDKPDVAAEKLVAFRSSYAADEIGNRMERGIDTDLEGLLPDQYGSLQSYGYEPGADVGAERESPEGDGAPADRQNADAGAAARRPQQSGEAASGGGTAQAAGGTSGVIEKPVATSPLKANMRGVEGTGEAQVRGLSEGVEAKAIEHALTDKFGDLPEYKTVSMADQAEKSAAYLDKDYESAKSVAMGQKAAPKGILPESIFVAVEKRALAEGDVETLRQLATTSKLTAEATTMGQRIRTLAERDPTSPVGAIQEVQKAREDAIKARGSVDVAAEKKVIGESIKSEMRKNVPKQAAWEAFVKSIECAD